MPSCKGDTVIFNHFSKNLNDTLIQTDFNNEWEMQQAIESVNYQRYTVSVVIYIVSPVQTALHGTEGPTGLLTTKTTPVNLERVVGSYF